MLTPFRGCCGAAEPEFERSSGALIACLTGLPASVLELVANFRSNTTPYSTSQENVRSASRQLLDGGFAGLALREPLFNLQSKLNSLYLRRHFVVGANNHSYGNGVFSVAQLGKVISLPANRNSKTLSYDLAFIENTGALKTFKLGTTGALDAATVDALSGVGGTILDARNKEKQKEDEVTVLTREDTILKLKDDICNIQKKYGLPCTVQPQ
jgi:hypothetical protein